jgi:BirA family biotin operon repressor/biotin-[acetyl-CoA-carboxylase] ligase
VSLLFRYDSEDVFRFARVVALASRAACRAVSGVAPHLKWPNDLVIDDLKLGGLLAVGAPGERFVVVGIGVNVSWAPEGAVCLRNAATTHIDFSPLVLLQHMLGEIDQRLAASDDDLHAEHRSALSTIGRQVRVELRAGEQLIGTAVDVDDASRLVVQDDAGVTHVIDVGDVIHLRAQ